MIQKELSFVGVLAGASSTKLAHVMTYDGEIQMYRVACNSSLVTVELLLNGISTQLNFEGDNIPLYITVNQGDEISVKVTNGDSASQTVYVMLLMLEF